MSFCFLSISMILVSVYAHYEQYRAAHSHQALYRNRASYLSTYKPEKDWSYHFDEEWTFLDEEPDRILSDVIANEPGDPYQVVYDLMKRVLGQKAYLTSQFSLELIAAEQKDDITFLSKEKHSNHPFWSKAYSLDVMELDNNGSSGIILRGSSTLALIVAFNWYLESYCNTTYDWRTYSLELPPQLPLPSYQKKVRSVPFSYYENVCTVSYTQAFWTWNEWEIHLDWMAMQGINLPLAFTGQEYVFSKTFYQFNFTQADLQAFFSGPGFFAWQRMGNLRGWAGPISQECIMDQYNLQLNILARMNSFNMTPALTAFAGHVPYAITKYYPKADVIPSPNWWGSTKEYCCDLLLNFTDPLFSEIGAAFIQQQSKYFGSGHVYQCDTFNEMDPPTTSTKYLNSASKYVYDSMQMADKDAVWLMQGWLFQYHGFWKPAQVQAYVGGVPNGAMIILDLYDDVSPQYNQFESFYGTPFIWCTLGTLYKGIWQNDIVYDETMKTAFETGELDMDQYALRRYGLPFSVKKTDQEMVINTMHNAWQQLATTVYNISHWGGVTKSLMCIRPSLNAITSGFMPTKLFYDPVVIQEVWRTFLTVSSTDIVNIEKYRYDLIDVSRQAISDQFFSYYKNNLKSHVHSYGIGKSILKINGEDAITEISDWDIDQILSTCDNNVYQQCKKLNTQDFGDRDICFSPHSLELVH